MNVNINEIDEMLAVQMGSLGDDDNGYMRGVYNGMEFIRCLITKTEPIFVNFDNELDPEAVERNPERFI